MLEPPAGSREDGVVPDLVFLRVPDDKTVKNRIHYDLRPDADQAGEVARLEALGARRADIGQGQPTWIVLSDPEGNEFCVLRILTPEELANGSAWPRGVARPGRGERVPGAAVKGQQDEPNQ